MKQVINYSVLLMFVMLFSACKNALNGPEYIKYLQEEQHGLRKKIKVGEWEYLMQYKTNDYIVLMENRNNQKGFNSKKRKEELKGSVGFNISFKVADGAISPMRYNLTSKDEYDQRLNYFLNYAGKYIRLIYDYKDTILPSGYLFENNYNLAPQETMVVTFNLPDGSAQPEKDMQLYYNDVLFKNGIIKAIFSVKDLKKVPELTID